MIDQQIASSPMFLALAEGMAGVAGRVVEDYDGGFINRRAEIVHDLDDSFSVHVAFVEVGMGVTVLVFEANCLHRRSMSTGDRHISSLTDGKPTVGDDAFERETRFIEVHDIQAGFIKQLRKFCLSQSECFFVPSFSEAATKPFPTQPQPPAVPSERLATDRFSSA